MAIYPNDPLWDIFVLPRIVGRKSDYAKLFAAVPDKHNGTDFYENGHQASDGNVEIYAIVKALVKNGFDGYVRPDHGRNIWGEEGKSGYGLYDRALGAAYLNGIFEAVEKDRKNG